MSTVISFTTTRVQFGSTFDSLKRYLRAGNVASSFPIAKGKTFFMGSDNSPGQNPNYSIWRYSVNGYVVQYVDTSSGLTDNASVTLVRT